MHYFHAQKLINDEFELSQETWHQIKHVLKIPPGAFMVIMFHDQHYLAQRMEIHNQSKIKKLRLISSNTNKDQRKWTLVAALIRQQKWNYMLQKCTELGVSTIVPLMTRRSVVKITDQTKNKKERWQKICQEAAEQSHRLTTPMVTDICFRLEDLKQYQKTHNLVCVPNQPHLPSLQKAMPPNQEYTVVVGPEGGFNSEEEHLLTKLGFTPVTLGQNILRSETAAIYIASIIKFIQT